MPLSKQEGTALRLSFKQLQDPTVGPLNRILDFVFGQLSTLDSGLKSALALIGKSKNETWAASGTHAARIANGTAGFPDGALYVETDRGSLYQAQLFVGGTDPVWVYVSGEMRGTLLPDQKPSDLGTLDTGFQFVSTDYLHKHVWSGTGWHFAAGDSSGYIVMSPGGLPPNGGIWAHCDGAAYNVAQDDGTIVGVATQNLENASGDPLVLQSAAAISSAKGATRSLWDAAAKTGNENATHQHAVTVVVATAYAAGANGGAVAGTYTSSVEDAVHQHALTNTDAVLKSPSEDGAHGGLPARIQTVWFLRR